MLEKILLTTPCKMSQRKECLTSPIGNNRVQMTEGRCFTTWLTLWSKPFFLKKKKNPQQTPPAVPNTPPSHFKQGINNFFDQQQLTFASLKGISLRQGDGERSAQANWKESRERSGCGESGQCGPPSFTFLIYSTIFSGLLPWECIFSR
jgi:hypothetical protein